MTYKWIIIIGFNKISHKFNVKFKSADKLIDDTSNFNLTYESNIIQELIQLDNETEDELFDEGIIENYSDVYEHGVDEAINILKHIVKNKEIK